MAETTKIKNDKKKNPLGRGLGSLLSSDIDFTNEPNTNSQSVVLQKGHSTPDELRIWQVPIHKIIPNHSQPRRHFDKSKIEELANSVRQKGILQPITVRKVAGVDEYEIIAGERRWRAAQTAGLQEIPVILNSSNDQDALELALIENIQREDLNPIEEAEAYQQLMDKYKLTQNEIAIKVGKERSTVANSMRLLTLTEKVREFVAKGLISVGHAKVILVIGDPDAQYKIANKIVVDKLSVRATELEVKRVQDSHKLEKNSDKTKSQSEESLKKNLLEGLAQDLQKSLGTKVRIDYSKAKGKINLFFYSDEGLSKLVEIIKRGSHIETGNRK